MTKARTFLLQLWQDQRGLWAVIKDEECGRLHQFESLDALVQFLSQGGVSPTPNVEAWEHPMGAPALALKS
ncbi:hypothetical protein [uncultured Meiothermus sp.]|jgi:hypothetical protein|uniref:hypothetical protein n=1 Tax=uncultured Meiothermus sp. TaxID=157471 RepID=UPI0026146B2D|nr:hypothetical protein [uncultured Meiothermus sp.]